MNILSIHLGDNIFAFIRELKTNCLKAIPKEISSNFLLFLVQILPLSFTLENN